MKSESLLQLMPINDLLGKHFFIPSYQRGYRWTAIQVNELLDDIWEFRKKSENGSSEEFYCLQPLVVTKKGNEWTLIDGQQRLTTIYLILRYLNDILLILNKEKYTLRYETRSDSETFLNDIDHEKSELNIDYYHICGAYKVIDEWFSKKDGNNKIHFLQTLLNDNESGKNVKVIWYEISPDSDPIEIFTRINIGKIPLTNAELIKALFLGKIKSAANPHTYHVKQIQIANEWDKIEGTLQNDSFWYFIYHGNTDYDTRIEYIFDLMMGKTSDDESHFTFHEFSKKFVNNPIDEIWLSIKRYFQVFEEWYNNQILYHLIGFLVSAGHSITILKARSEELTKSEFKEDLRSEIGEKINYAIEDLKYGDKRIRNLLLLFNIQTIVGNKHSNIRFPFDSYKKENWDIEHIRSVKSEKPLGNKQRKWLINVLEYFLGETDPRLQIDELNKLVDHKHLAMDIWELLQKEKISDIEFTNLYERVLKEFKEDTEPSTINSISNLALLDARTNRGYKNAVFPIKRRKIIENDMSGTFIPICTRNVFLKSYSETFENAMFWQESDAKDYLGSIIKTLSIFQVKNG